MNDKDSLEKIFAELLGLYERKNNDYGDSYKDFGVYGLVIRMSDKMSRLKSLINKKDCLRLVKDETLLDTLQDLSLYACLAILLLEKGRDESTRI